ncbi:hypothetical protein EDC02_5246 [Micromonospora sp. Llam0]|uniref:hypothetical protein n=1 Tax=Micromonospora sp. Llam0 TaxID=2485143 RepID=UPI000FAC6B84|nr:hypothetical protein [Micromonospora sp. Llam0]ROO63225.1 hypothetical protein EDC02_5246 [Micromonospora sp. Llam0]
MPSPHELVEKAARDANLGDFRWHYRPVVAFVILAGVTLIVQGAIMTLVSWLVGAALVLAGAAIAATSLLMRRNAMLLLYTGGIAVSGVAGRLKVVAPWHHDRVFPVAAFTVYKFTLWSGERVRFAAAAVEGEVDLVEEVRRAGRK